MGAHVGPATVLVTEEKHGAMVRFNMCQELLDDSVYPTRFDLNKVKLLDFSVVEKLLGFQCTPLASRWAK